MIDEINELRKFPKRISKHNYSIVNFVLVNVFPMQKCFNSLSFDLVALFCFVIKDGRS
jgi:hypothetical protein